MSHSTAGGFTGKDTGEQPSLVPTIAPTSGRPTAAPAWSLQDVMSSAVERNNAAVPTSARSCEQAVMTELRARFAFNFESMKSTTSLRPAIPPPPALLLMYFAAPCTPSTTPWKRPGEKGLSTSATTAIRISVAVTPISVALGAGAFVCADTGIAATAPTVRVMAPTNPTTATRKLRTVPHDLSASGASCNSVAPPQEGNRRVDRLSTNETRCQLHPL